MPIIREILLLLIAVFIFLVLYDCLVMKKKFKEALAEKIFFFLLPGGLGCIIRLIGLIVIVFVVYSIFFE